MDSRIWMDSTERILEAPLQGGRFGPLEGLVGVWKGLGYNMIAVPDFKNGKGFRLITNATTETLTFTPIDGTIPNRGEFEEDIEMHGITYMQQIDDAHSKEGIHIEPGIWLLVPPTKYPPAPQTVVRQAAIPHGDSLLAQGAASSMSGAPIIPPANTLPSPLPGRAPFPHEHLAPYHEGGFVSGFNMLDPNQALRDVLARQTVLQTTALGVSTEPSGGIVNIPFVVKNANTTKMTSTFWLETVQGPNGPFQQLQYTQTVVLEFGGGSWPHVSVATLIKQQGI